MKKWIGIGVGILLSWSCGKPALPTEAETILGLTRQQYCPDKRVCIWDIEALPGKTMVLKGKTNLPEAKEALLRTFSEKGIPFTDSLQLLPAAALEGKHFGLVNLSVCNIRSEPRHSAELATQATLGTPLKIFDQHGEWFRVQTPDRYLGWVDAGGLILLDTASMTRWKQSDRIIVQTEVSDARLKPAPDSQPVCDLVSGCIMEKKGETGDYYRVVLPDGDQAFVPKKHARPLLEWKESGPPQTDGILETAISLMGRPYLWGGTSAKGMDCSGFTKTVFFQHGLILPRDASQQVHAGTAVADTSFLPGDLLFFGRKPEEKITHVAIYLGEGQFIHASGEVKVESLIPSAPNYSGYRHSTFIRAKRILPPAPADLSLSNLDWYFL